MNHDYQTTPVAGWEAIETMQVIYKPKGKALEYSSLAANLYRGCAHGCRYCYAPKVVHMDRVEFHINPRPRQNILSQFEADCHYAKEPVLLSFTTDPYQPIEQTYRLTREAIVIAHAYGVGIEILTKGALYAQDDFHLLDPRLDAFAVTLTFIRARDSHVWEPNAAMPRERLYALERAHQKGIRTWASLEPVIEPEQSLELIRASAGFVDFYKIGRWNYDPRANDIDWPDFGNRAVELLEKLGKKYLIKKDLREAMNVDA